MKMPGDGFLPPWFKREICPGCHKKGVYYSGAPDRSIGDHKCMYCRKFFFRSELYQDLKNGEKPANDEIIIGYDEETKKDITVSYRADSNRFFDHPYTGSVYPISVMHRWRKGVIK